jgi:hypothetical protein
MSRQYPRHATPIRAANGGLFTSSHRKIPGNARLFKDLCPAQGYRKMVKKG